MSLPHEDAHEVLVIGPEGEDIRALVTSNGRGVEVWGWREYGETAWRDIGSLTPQLLKEIVTTAEYEQERRRH